MKQMRQQNETRKTSDTCTVYLHEKPNMLTVICVDQNGELPVPLLVFSMADPLTRLLPLVIPLVVHEPFDVIVEFDPVDDGCGFSTIYFDLRSWTGLLKLFTSS